MFNVISILRCRVNSKEKNETIFNEIRATLDAAGYFLEFINKKIGEIKHNNQRCYLSVNDAYFRMSKEFYESFLTLIIDHKDFSAIVILRTQLEIYVKSFYLEFVVKQNDGSLDVDSLISNEKFFPAFHVMANKIDSYESEHGFHTGGHFRQFTKSILSTYEKLSYFTHGKGPYLEVLLKSDSVQLDIENTRDLLITAKGVFEMLSLLYFGTQGRMDLGREALNELLMINPEMYKSS